MMTSADGYHADPGQALDWHNVDQEFSQFALAQLREAGTLVFGRVTYEGMAAFWPTPAGEESDPEVAKAMNTTPKIVISRTLPQATWAGTRIISNHAEEELAKLKQQPGQDIVRVHGARKRPCLIEVGAAPLDTAGPGQERSGADGSERAGRAGVDRTRHPRGGGKFEGGQPNGPGRVVEQLVAREMEVPPRNK